MVQVELWTLAWKWRTLIQNITYKEVYFSSCLVFFCTPTSHRLKKNNFLHQNLNYSNFLFLVYITFSSPDLNCYFCWSFLKSLRNILGRALRSNKLRLYILQLPSHWNPSRILFCKYCKVFRTGVVRQHLIRIESFFRNLLQKANTYLVFILHTVEINCNLILKNDWTRAWKNYLIGLGLTLWYIGLGLEKYSNYLTGVRLILWYTGLRPT